MYSPSNYSPVPTCTPPLPPPHPSPHTPISLRHIVFKIHAESVSILFYLNPRQRRRKEREGKNWLFMPCQPIIIWCRGEISSKTIKTSLIHRLTCSHKQSIPYTYVMFAHILQNSNLFSIALLYSSTQSQKMLLLVVFRSVYLFQYHKWIILFVFHERHQDIKITHIISRNSQY